ncbi:HSPB1-associated protein 1 homolog isoform X1 [Hypomesus transpacificus]|uniref:HSPB1-associated protein 1 homolog isoform X1 n=1 Tax=Hypomesus transpacificus TaxID=137520 RepID=UPI001F079C51|nr:HSPB1-associated protein 1 homolog isoform X1 [Hypomesus transpacificus]XP_046902031.1 HSPB1-associated protein 1 homolog isoform X1 [Hypomesus transpacificus]XP_046902032.1 HSPB1-associated protein 1 homolog isoform X1 [Hypomesus transpacificus]
MAAKPFSPKEVRRILDSLSRPAVFLHMTHDWPVLHWTANHLSDCLDQKNIRFRLGEKQATHTPLFETQCSYVEASLDQFLCWTSKGTGTEVGLFSGYPLSEYWAYADYKYIAMLFQDQPSMFEDVVWSDFGYPGRAGRESTLWIGTGGANTPCHQDTYGCNLVLQVQGRKRWTLFPPEDTARLYPSRVPYEESSVFSLVDVLQPDLRRFPAFSQARAHTVTLQPGQVLYVPRHWWHYVESVDPVTVSVNSWIELDVDDEARVNEAVTKAVVCALKTTPSKDNTDDWLNPTEEGVSSHGENLQCLNLAVHTCLQRRERGQGAEQERPEPGGGRGAKRDSSGQTRGGGGGTTPLTIPFGPHLVPVPSNQDGLPKSKGLNSKDGEDGSPKSCMADPSKDPRPRVLSDSGECGSGSDDYCSPGRDCDSGDAAEALGRAPITTNDLLECLVHPDVIAHVTKLLLERQNRQNNA